VYIRVAEMVVNLPQLTGVMKPWRRGAVLFPGFDDFADVQAFQVTLDRGDLLYLPKYWWHQVAQGAMTWELRWFFHGVFSGNRKECYVFS
jgi:hypothetical protein